MKSFYKNKIPTLVHLTKDEMKNRFYSGWHPLIDMTFEVISLLPTTKIVNAIRNDGMLRLYVEGDAPWVFGAEGMCWRIERESQKVCEMCGKFGWRRKELKKIMCLCSTCYFVYLNELESPETAFRKGKESPFLD